MNRNLQLIALILFLFFQYNFSLAAKYYFSASGDDSRSAAQAQNQSTPWKSINKLNAIFKSLQPGDEVLFKRGDTFYGTINISRSGAKGKPIKIGAYGSGNKPVITSLVTINEWKNVGNGVYESSHAIGNEVNVVLINNEIHGMGRFPNSDAPNGGYLTIDSHAGNSSVVSNGLSSSVNFTGGEVVIRKNQWVIDRHKIISHSGNRVNYFGGVSTAPAKDYGFFIQGHRSTLDQKGEWYFNSSNRKLYVFFGSDNPGTTKVEASNLEFLLTKSYGASHISVDNLHFKGANKDAIHISGGRGFLVENTDIEFSGEHGITSMSVTELVINNSRINHSFNNGIYLRYGNVGAKVTNNIVENTFIFPGSSDNGDNNGIGIFAMADNTFIEYNKVINTGYSGIYFGGNSTTVKNNLIDTYCMLKNDGGGIYSYGGPNNISQKNRKLIGNIILNGVGSTDGVPKKSFTSRGQAEGIFLDDNSNGIEVIGNTIADAENSGIKLANTRNIIVQNNTIYNSNSQILIGNRGRAAETRDLKISKNILFSKYPDQWAYIIRTKKNDVSRFGSFEGNYLYRPLGDPYSILVSLMDGDKENNKIFDLKRWQKSYEKDQGSSISSTPLQAFKVRKYLRDNIFENESLNQGVSGLMCNSCKVSFDKGKLSSGSAKVESSSYSSLAFAIGAVKESSNYILSFKATSNKDGALRIYLRHTGSPWEEVSASTTVDLGSGTKEYSVLLQPYADIQKTTVMMASDEGSWTYWVDDVELKEAEVDIAAPKDQFFFEYNASKSPKTVTLNGTYVDVQNRSHTGRVTLEPYSSLLLIKTSKGETPTPKYELQANISTPQNNFELSEGDELEIQAEALASDEVVLKVEFFNGKTLLGTSSKAPYKFTWDDIPAGSHVVTAVATGNGNRTATSEAVTIKVSEVRTDDGISGGDDGSTGSFSPLHYNIGSKSQVEYEGNVFKPIPEATVVSNRNSSHYPQASESGLFQSTEYGKTLEYKIPVPNGSYMVQTYHHEVYYGKSGPSERNGQRIFDISIENQIVEKDYDMYVANGNKETVLTFGPISVTDGFLNVSMESSVENAIISGISVLPFSGASQPVEIELPENAILINAGGQKDVFYSDHRFVSDFSTRYFSGSSNINSNSGASIEELFQTHRFSREFSYNISVPNGKYTVITYHNEIHFGKAIKESGPRKRVFDIYLENKLVKSDLDLYKESENQPVTLFFENIEVTDGEINLGLSASINSATISGIAIIPESGKPSLKGANFRMATNQFEEAETQELFVVEQQGVKLYPNPASDRVILSSSTELGKFSILIHNLTGQLIDHLDPDALSRENNGYILPVNHLQEGVYVVTLAGERQILERIKLMIKR